MTGNRCVCRFNAVDAMRQVSVVHQGLTLCNNGITEIACQLQRAEVQEDGEIERLEQWLSDAIEVGIEDNFFLHSTLDV